MNLSQKEKVSFGIGAIGKDMVYALVANFILYYYNTVLGVSATFVGVILMAARIFDAFNDPLMGIVVAKTNTRFGKFRPWIMLGTVTNAIVLILMFAVPDSLTSTNLLIYITVMYFLWGITYTFMDIPYWSMIPAVTESGKDRENLSVVARTCAGIGGAIPPVVTMALLPIIGGGRATSNYRVGFKWLAVIVAVFFVVATCICCKNVKEQREEKMKTHTIKQMVKALISNHQALTVVLTIILVNTSLYITSNLIIYFFQYDLGNEGLYSIFYAFGGAAQILMMVLFPVFREKFSKKKLFVLAALAEIGGYVILLGMALCSIQSVYPFFLPGLLVFGGNGLISVLTTIFLSDSVDYGEYKNGHRDESVIFSLQTFVYKLASGIAVLLVGVGIDLIKLDTTVVKQTDSTILGLRLMMTVIPTIGLILALIFFTKNYVLTEEQLDEITKFLKGKKETEQ